MCHSLNNWICPRCLEELGELNGYCEYCFINDGSKVYNPDKYYIREIRIRHICSERSETLTPQEELFSQLFNHEKILIRDMDVLTLRAHREELAKIAFEARARLTAVDDEEKDRRKKKDSDGKPTGFERSLNADDTATNAINTIKERQKRMSKSEKIQDGLEAMFIKSGMSLADAEKEAKRLMGAGTILSKLKPEETAKTENSQESKTTTFNPFEKKQ